MFLSKLAAVDIVITGSMVPRLLYKEESVSQDYTVSMYGIEVPDGVILVKETQRGMGVSPLDTESSMTYIDMCRLIDNGDGTWLLQSRR